MELHDGLFAGILLTGSLALAAVTFGLSHLALYLRAKTKSIALQGFITRADDLAERVVKEVWQSYVQPIQEAGKWDAVSAALAKQQAVAKLKSYIGPAGISAIEELFKPGASVETAQKTTNDFLSTMIESAVHDAKVESAAPAGTQAKVPSEARPAGAAPNS